MNISTTLEEECSLLDMLDPLGSYSSSILVLDEIQYLFLGLDNDSSSRLLFMLADLVQRAEDHSCTLILSGNAVLPWLLFSIQNQNVRTKYSMITQSVVSHK